jgi:hypothetical protein
MGSRGLAPLILNHVTIHVCFRMINFTPRPLHLLGRHRHPMIWSWIGSRAGLDFLEKTNISSLYRDSNPGPSVAYLLYQGNNLHLSVDHTKHTHTLCGRNIELLNQVVQIANISFKTLIRRGNCRSLPVRLKAVSVLTTSAV